MTQYDRNEVWEAVQEISDIRGRYNLFSPKERPKYHACSLAIRALRDVIGEPVETDGNMTITYEQAINKLKYLKSCAETVDKYEDDIIDDYRQMARFDMREIIDILLALDFGEEESK